MAVDVPELLRDWPESLAVHRAVQAAVRDLAEVTVHVTRSQVAFSRRTGFTFVWRPGRYVRNPVPAVMSIALPRELFSARFKKVAHLSPRVWMHHLELSGPDDVDDEVRGWLAEAYAEAG